MGAVNTGIEFAGPLKDEIGIIGDEYGRTIPGNDVITVAGKLPIVGSGVMLGSKGFGANKLAEDVG